MILGGGSGDVLEYLIKEGKAGRITFVEISGKMINKAKARISNLKNPPPVYFINDSYITTPEENYDLVVTNFFMDLFDEREVNTIAEMIYSRLNKKGILLNTDFYNAGYSPFKTFIFKGILNILYCFFSFFCVLNTSYLPDIERVLRNKTFNLVQSKTYFFGFIRTELWRKG